MALGWVVFGSVLVVVFYYLGYITGRESSDLRWQQTVADLRVANKRLSLRVVDHADDRRPE